MSTSSATTLSIARNFGQIKQEVSELLDRDDITPELLNQFTLDGINRTNRVLGQYLPAYEKEVTLTADANGRLNIPTDFLSVVDFIESNNDNRETEFRFADRDTLKQFRLQPGVTTSLTQFEQSNNRGFFVRQQPVRYYTRRVDQFEFAPPYDEGDTVQLIYRSDPVGVCEDTDTIPVLLFAPEAVKYASLIYAALYYNDVERQRTFAEVFTQIITEVKDHNDEQEMDQLNLAFHNFRPDELF